MDSALVYRGLDIGTAKPARALRERVPHHLIDICDPADSYSAGRFVADALGWVRDIHARGRVPLLVGGTMLYLRALLRGLAVLPPAVPELRAADRCAGGPRGLAGPARGAGPPRPGGRRRASRPADAQRIQRALEVCYSTGQPDFASCSAPR